MKELLSALVITFILLSIGWLFGRAWDLENPEMLKYDENTQSYRDYFTEVK